MTAIKKTGKRCKIKNKKMRTKEAKTRQKLSEKKNWKNRKWFYSLSESGRRGFIRWWDCEFCAKSDKGKRLRVGAGGGMNGVSHNCPFHFNLSSMCQNHFSNLIVTHGHWAITYYTHIERKKGERSRRRGRVREQKYPITNRNRIKKFEAKK